MVFLVFTRQAIANLSDRPGDDATTVYVNPGVLTEAELAQMQASGSAVVVLPHAINADAHAELKQLVDGIRRTHGETVWVEHPTPSTDASQETVASLLEEGPEQAPLIQTFLTSAETARAVSGWALGKLKRFSSPDSPAMIVPYMGFGTAGRFVLQGRVIQDAGFAPPSEAHSALSNFFELYKRIDSVEVPGAKVIARFQNMDQGAITDSDGYFRIEFVLPQPLERSGWHEVELRLVNSSTQPNAVIPSLAQVLVPPSTARFGVISDIDDTVLWSNVTNKFRMLKMLAVKNAHTRKPFKGVTAFYCALRDGIGGDEGNPIFYVSSSPWHLYTPLVDFFQAQGIPLGPLMLKELGVKHLIDRGRHHSHKLSNIEKILQTYPTLPFVLIGDSGEQDPEIYQKVVKMYPRRIRAIYIRNVNPDPSRIEALDRLIDEVRTTGTQLLLVPDSESAAAHAAGEGLINPLSMQRVRTDKHDDSNLLGIRT
jgi:phosphatidate phosphatase APP1